MEALDKLFRSDPAGLVQVSLADLGQQPGDAEGYVNATPLMVAAGEGHAAVVRTLVESGAQLDAVDDQGQTALALARERGHKDGVEILKRAGARDGPPALPPELRLLMAAERGDAESVRQLIVAGAPVNVRDQRKKTGGCTPLILAARGGHVEILRLLIEAGAQVDARDDEGESDRSAIASVWALGGEEGVEAAGWRLGRTALMVAARGGHADAVRLLVDAGATVELRDKTNLTALGLAAGKGHSGVAERLIEAGADVNARLARRATPLILALEGNHTDAARVLIGAGADLNLKDGDGHTALMLAVMCQNETVVRWLLEAGADVLIESRQGESAGEMARGLPAGSPVRGLIAEAARKASRSGAGKESPVPSKGGRPARRRGGQASSPRPPRRKGGGAAAKAYDAEAVVNRLQRRCADPAFQVLVGQFSEVCGTPAQDQVETFGGFSFHVRSGRQIDVEGLQDRYLPSGAFVFCAEEGVI